MNKAEIDYYSRLRTSIHKGTISQRALSKDHDRVGLIGELAFSKEFNVPVDLNLRPAGDNRVDFEINGITIDVKTFRKPYNLIIEPGKDYADILVLAGYSDVIDEAWLIGWEFSSIMKKCPVKKFKTQHPKYPYIENHYKPAEKLHPIIELKEYLRMIVNDKEV